jgi:hypothetical protein
LNFISISNTHNKNGEGLNRVTIIVNLQDSFGTREVNVAETLIGFWNRYIHMNEQKTLLYSLDCALKRAFQEEKLGVWKPCEIWVLPLFSGNFSVL